MPIFDAASNAPLDDKLLQVAARSGQSDFHHHYRRLEQHHGKAEVHKAADDLEQRGLIEWPDRESPATLSATEAGRAQAGPIS